MASLQKSMFREYDIRGHETPEELNDESITLIAKGYGAFLAKNGIKDAVVGHDNRKTSESFYKHAVKALTESGINVIGIGMSLTPMLYWAQHHFKVDGGFMITASHNPVGWNGVKLARGLSYTLNGQEIQEVFDFISKDTFVAATGSFREENVGNAYIADLLTKVTLHKKLKILLNTANATAGFFSPKLLRDFGCEVVEHNTNPDPSYPNYVPNPANVGMMEDTGRKVVENGCDLGVGIDADGDRVGLVDEKGNIIWPDRLMILLSRSVLEKRPGAKIIFDVKVSEALPEDITAHGGVPIMWKTGHSYIKEKMRETGAAFAGEQSGHFFFVDGYYGFDDGNFAALKLLEYTSAQNKPLSEIMKDTPYYISTPAYHAHTPDDTKYGIVEKLTAEFKTEGNRVVDINGARVYFPNGGWGLVRASSNLPALVLRFEAKNEEALKEIEKIFRAKLTKYPDVATEWESA